MVSADEASAALDRLGALTAACQAVASKCWTARPKGQRDRAERDARDDRAWRIAAVLEDEATLAALAAAPVGRYEAALGELADVRGCGRQVAAIRRAVRAAGKQTRKPARLRVVEPGEVATSGLGLGRADLGHLRAPDGYFVSGGCTYRLDEDGEAGSMVAAGIVVVTAILEELDEDGVHLRIEWLYQGRWRSATVSRAMLASSREVVALAGRGLPVTSASARELVVWLSRFEHANRPRLPAAYVVRRLGWTGSAGELGFLWGRTLLRDVPHEVDGAPTTWPARSVSLVADGGAAQIAEAYRARGDFGAWRVAVGKLAAYPLAALALFSSLAAPLLRVTDAPNFVIDWSGKSSHGKTSALRVAASCWGLPSERDGGCIHTWDSTAVGGERAAEMTQYIPLLLDDTKRARRPEDVDAMLYRVYSGRGRLRGRPDGMRKSSTWRTILLSTGEVPATSFSKSQGARARVLSLRGMPFGDGGSGEVVEELVGELMEHHGHAGPALVMWLHAHRDQWPALVEEYRGYVADQAAGSSNAFARRAAPYVGLLRLAARLASEVLGVGLLWSDVAECIELASARSVADADVGALALDLVVGWAASHATAFQGRHEADPRTQAPRMPSGGWAGRWEGEEVEEFGADVPRWNGSALYFVPAVLRRVLTDQGYDDEAVFDDWAARGWLVRQGRRRSVVRRVFGQSVRLVGLSQAALDAVGGGGE
jgi:putative DNA primase/helicase